MATTLSSLVADVRDEIGDIDETDYIYEDPKIINLLARTAILFNSLPLTAEVKISGSGDSRYLDPDFANPYKEPYTRLYVLLTALKILNAELMTASRTSISKSNPLGNINLQDRANQIRQNVTAIKAEIIQMSKNLGFHDMLKNNAKLAFISISDPYKAQYDTDSNSLDSTTIDTQDAIEKLGI